MDDGWLKSRLRECKAGPFHKTDFSIGHRGAALQFPEHTKESYEAGARQGAGIVECDVTFTRDGKLVCRHSDCDLHTTTNIIDTPLNDKCEVPWTGPSTGPNPKPAPKCCTWNVTLEEFKTLRGKMDASNPAATTPAGYLGGTASWRTDLYTGRGTLLTVRESIRLNEKLGVGHTPELKGGDATQIEQILGGQQQYAQKLIDVLREEGVDPRRVWLAVLQHRRRRLLGRARAGVRPPRRLPRRRRPDESRALPEADARRARTGALERREDRRAAALGAARASTPTARSWSRSTRS